MLPETRISTLAYRAGPPVSKASWCFGLSFSPVSYQVKTQFTECLSSKVGSSLRPNRKQN